MMVRTDKNNRTSKIQDTRSREDPRSKHRTDDWSLKFGASLDLGSWILDVRGGFTLIELILVMTVLTIAVSITAPALANFFRARSLDSEARRLLALTRQGQSRAVSEGVPMELWVDAAQGTYGLEAQTSYEPSDPKAVTLVLDQNVQLQLLATSPDRATAPRGVPANGSVVP